MDNKFNDPQNKKSEDRADIQHSTQRGQKPPKKVQIRVGVKSNESDKMVVLPIWKPTRKNASKQEQSVAQKNRIYNIFDVHSSHFKDISHFRHALLK